MDANFSAQDGNRYALGTSFYGYFEQLLYWSFCRF